MGIYVGADVSQTYTTLGEGKTPALGDVFWGAGNKAYKFVQYKEGAAAVDGVLGEVAYYYTLDGYKLNQVTSDLSDSIEIGAGVLQSNVSENEYCWIQIKGMATLTIALTAGADGDPLTPTGAADGTLDVSTAVTDNICAIAGDISDNEIICDFTF
jgi:hypothetical protein